MLFELLLIFLLILINGFFSAVEIAVITARKSHLRRLAEEGNLNAHLVSEIQLEPERFLATIQIGVTLLGSAAAAVGGATAMKTFKPILENIPFLQPFSGFLSVSLMVLIISYVSLVLGELLPKSLALKYPEQIAMFFVRPVIVVAKGFSPVVKFLTRSIHLFIKPVGGKVFRGTLISEDEIKFLLKEGREKGVFDQTEQELIHSVFEFNDISVKEVMIPRPNMSALQMDTPMPELLRQINEHKCSRYPVYKANLNEIVGILYFKDMIGMVIEGGPMVLKELLHPAYFVPETMPVSRLLKQLQRRRIQMAIVVNEYGSVEGLVTMEDLVEEIVGEIQDEYDAEERPVERMKDGSLVVDASLFVRDLNSDHGLPIPDSSDYETLGGFVLEKLQDMPKAGDIIRFDGHKFTIVDMDGRRIAKVKIELNKEMPVSAPD